MLRSNSALLTLSLSLLLGSGCDGPAEPAEPDFEPPAAAQVPGGLARLVPADAFAFVELESLNALNLCSRDLIGVLDADEAESYDLAQSLGHLLGIEGPIEFADPTRPIGLAWSLPAGAVVPIFTLIVALGPGEWKVEEIVAQGVRSTTILDGWIALSHHGDYRPCGDDTSFSQELPAGQVRARIDLRRIVDTYRDLIDAGLDQAEMAIDAAANDPEIPSGFDLVAIMDLYFEGIRMMLDGVDRLDVGIEVAGTEIGLEAWLDVLPESPLAVVSAGEPTSLPELARTVDPGSAVVFLMAFDWQGSKAWLQPVLDTVFGAYPEDFALFMATQMEHYTELYPLLGTSMAASGGFGKGGMRFAYVAESPDPRAYIDGYTELVTSQEAVHGFAVEGPLDRHVGDVGISEFRTTFSEDFYALMLGQDAADMSDEEREALRASMEAMYGPDGLVVRMAPAGDRLAMVMGGDDDYFSRAYDRMLEPDGDLPPALERALARVGHANPAIVAHVDLARIVAQLWETIRELPGAERPESLARFDHLPVTFTSWGAVDGTEWRGGFVFDLARIAEWGQALAASGASGHDPDPASEEPLDESEAAPSDADGE